jgi:hypothetical protein
MMLRRIFSTIGFTMIAMSFIGLLAEPGAFFLTAIAQLVGLIFLLPSAHSLTVKQRRAFRVALFSIILMLAAIPYGKVRYATIISRHHSAVTPASLNELRSLERQMALIHIGLFSVTQVCVIFSSWYLLGACWRIKNINATGAAD